jgi:hypothetical protein
MILCEVGDAVQGFNLIEVLFVHLCAFLTFTNLFVLRSCICNTEFSLVRGPCFEVKFILI